MTEHELLAKIDNCLCAAVLAGATDTLDRLEGQYGTTDQAELGDVVLDHFKAAHELADQVTACGCGYLAVRLLDILATVAATSAYYASGNEPDSDATAMLTRLVEASIRTTAR